MQKVKNREIRHYHEVLHKDDRPQQGKNYILSMNSEPLYVAELTDYNGGCWAKVKVLDTANDKYEHLYREGMEFDIKVAFYSFAEVELSVQVNEQV